VLLLSPTVYARRNESRDRLKYVVLGDVPGSSNVAPVDSLASIDANELVVIKILSEYDSIVESSVMPKTFVQI